jgi:hypothetical protein
MRGVRPRSNAQSDVQWNVDLPRTLHRRTTRKSVPGVMSMIHMLMFLPRLFRYFGMFQTFVSVIRPFWPRLAQFWQRPRPSAAFS